MTSSTIDDTGVVTQRPAPLPTPRGPASAAVVAVLRERSPEGDPAGLMAKAIGQADDLLRDDDVQLAAFCLYELHYGGFRGVPDTLEWDADLLTARAIFEGAFEAELRRRAPRVDRPAPRAEDVAHALFRLTEADDGPSLSQYVARKATQEQLREFLIQRSLYTLKEADPHSWGIPRLTGRAKAALVEIQSDEYGAGRPHRMHSAIFARTMRAAGLDPSYGAYLDQVGASLYASLNTMSLFGLNRRLRGALVGHLAAFEMTSAVPNRFYGNGFRRLGFDEEATWYFDEHVEADAVHEQIAARDLAGGFVEAEPNLLGDVLFGASACLYADGLAGADLLQAFTESRSSLYRPA
ncbi:iron-containing redox enzyme family protein [Herbiconiux sp. SYSU D00978]|uniref:iron-containing redox enzyme family protein n=1 Tax=Herbiconiux sp. SYSU D00978 TaxID=2812562 RepID=UPI0027DCA379|nr:iron-containing redox enzyme family protein [Herbiconiux sp. SYSU D00978]